MAARRGYQFLPLSTADLALVGQWLAMPHVVKWWGDPLEQFELVSSDLRDPAMEQFVVITDGVPFGYLQCYDLLRWPTEAFGPQPDGTRGIDQFIGKPEMVNRGHGSHFISHFVDGLLSTGTPRVITDPAAENSRAIRAYEKAGFVRHRLVETADGPAVLMVRTR
jgi:aminoglycoside 6'-N-acetyltransferase